jgi:hypothetical protein
LFNVFFFFFHFPCPSKDGGAKAAAAAAAAPVGTAEGEPVDGGVIARLSGRITELEAK